MNRCQFYAQLTLAQKALSGARVLVIHAQESKTPGTKHERVGAFLREADAAKLALDNLIQASIHDGEISAEACGRCEACAPAQDVYVAPEPQTNEVLGIVEEYNQGGPLARWLSFGRRGESSNSIVEHLTGLPATRTHWGQPARPLSYPYDLGDFRLCCLLLEEVPALAPLLPRMESVSLVWKRLVMHWGALTKGLEKEMPNWRDMMKTVDAPKTRELFQAILKGRVK